MLGAVLDYISHFTPTFFAANDARSNVIFDPIMAKIYLEARLDRWLASRS